MKRVLSIIILVLLLAGCSTPSIENTVSYANTATSGVWISYSEINSLLTSQNGFENEFEKVILNLRQLNIQNLYIHVHAFCDSLYKSDYFPLISAAESYQFDVFEYMLTKCHQNGIKVHAWINPYRVSTASSDIETLNTQSPAYKWLKDENTENDRNVCILNGIYLNPAEPQVQKLIIDGIKEIIEKYDVDGIHFDDYFYPTTSPQFDEVSYTDYCIDKENPLSLEDWRRNNINLLLSGCYNAIKYIDSDILFTVSPMASIKQNYNNLYADVKEWIKGGYIDYIIPQLYFGFEYTDDQFEFENLLTDWKKTVKDSDVGLLIGLASYKSIPELEEDKEEWENNYDIIARQVEICKDDNLVQGYVYFSYSSLFGEAEAYVKQRENILKLENENG